MKQDELINDHSSGEETILTRHNGQYISIILKDILFCEAEGNFTNVYIMGDQRLVIICRRLSFFKRKLRINNDFIRCHKTYIINLNEVICFCIKSRTLMISDYEIPIARREWGKIIRILIGKGLKNRENIDRMC